MALLSTRARVPGASVKPAVSPINFPPKTTRVDVGGWTRASGRLAASRSLIHCEYTPRQNRLGGAGSPRAPSIVFDGSEAPCLRVRLAIFAKHRRAPDALAMQFADAAMLGPREADNVSDAAAAYTNCRAASTAPPTYPSRRCPARHHGAAASPAENRRSFYAPSSAENVAQFM